MAMRKSTRQELRKLRELSWFLLRGKKCWLCKQSLLNGRSYAMDGDGQGSPVRNITVHHKDHNHSNDAESNKVLVHDKPCHRAHHTRERHKAGVYNR